MATLTKTTVLYGGKNASKTPKTCRTKVGKAMPMGIAMSRYNTSGAVVKISSAAICLDQLLLDKMYFAYAGDNTIVLEIGKNVILTNGTDAKTNLPAEPEDILLADILWEMEFGGNEEMRKLFDSFKKAKLPLSEKAVAQFCDSYYCHNVKSSYAINVEQTLTTEEVEAGIRSGLLKRASVLKGLEDLQKSRFEDVPVVKQGRIKKTEAPAIITTDAFMEDCRRGKYILPVDWDEAVKGMITPLEYLDDTVPDEFFKKLVTKLQFRYGRVLKRMENHTYKGFDDIQRVRDLGPDAVNVTLIGPPGSGKSHVVYAAAAATGIPVLMRNNSHNTEEGEYEGWTKIVDGKPVTIPTEAVICFMHGGILLLEEVNLAPPAVIMGVLGQAVEDPYILKKDGYINIRRHPLCSVVSTMNRGTAGTKLVAEQFANRFTTSYVINEPKREAFIERLIAKTGEDRRLCTWTYDVYSKITESVREDNAQADVEKILNALSLRSCIGAIQNIQEGSDPKEAVCDSVIGKIAEQDWEVAENCRKLLTAIVDFRPDGR